MSMDSIINSSLTDPASITQNISSLLPEARGESTSLLGLLGWVLLALIRILPFLVYWIIRFTTITLTEVGNGAPMSSLFSILSLFTEHLQTRHDSDLDRPDTGSSNVDPSFSGMQAAADAEPVTPGSDIASPMTSPHRFTRGQARERRASSYISAAGTEQLPGVPPLSLDTEDRAEVRRPPKEKRPRAHRTRSIHPDIVARATVDTTIAIIPATAFRRLTRIYPKATAHIVAVILTRLQRVTLATAHTYLGLTNEVLKTERLMNKYTTYELPNFLRDSALERLKEKFAKERHCPSQSNSWT